MTKKKIFALELGVICALCNNVIIAKDSTSSIIENITSSGKCSIYQSEKLDSRLNKLIENNDTIKNNSKQYISGYRIQVFSDNNSRTAKGEARNKARDISEKFPELRTYVIYNAPFWRLRVGDFRTPEDANDVVVRLKEEFPSFSKEIRVVRDRINYIVKE